MKILSFSVNNFRGISGGLKQNTIEFRGSNTIFIFGQNNVGKSSFLNAYQFYYGSDAPTEDDLFQRDITNKIEFELCVELDKYDFQRIEKVAPTKTESVKKYLANEKVMKVKREYMGTQSGTAIKFGDAKNFTWNPESSTWDDSCYGSIGLDRVFQACLPKPILIKAMPTETEAETIINTILAEKAAKVLKDSEQEELINAKETIKKLQEKMYNPTSIKNYKENVNAHFQKLFPETQIELEEGDKVKWTEDKLGKKYKIHFEKKDKDGNKDKRIPTSYEKIGHGAVRTAIFTLMLMRDVAEDFERCESRKDYIVLFEEPELFLHPRLTKELRTLIYKVSEEDFPYQVLCASHSPQMIDITKQKSSLVRMTKIASGTQLFQIDEAYLKEAKGVESSEQLKKEMYEVLRFNPFICESFYADAVLLVEGPTEEIVIRGYCEVKPPIKDIFIVNCGTVNNIPFYQKIFSKFNINYHVICDTDDKVYSSVDASGNPVFTDGIQGSIYNQIKLDNEKSDGHISLLRVHNPTFEPAHASSEIPDNLRYKEEEEYPVSNGKPMNGNLYWRNVLSPNLDDPNIQKVPIIHYLSDICL